MFNRVFDLLKNQGCLPGMIVTSTKGHDKGRVYLIVKQQERFIYLVDGRYRSINKLKKKRVSHVKLLGKACDEKEASKLFFKSNIEQTDIFVRKLIQNFLETKIEEG